MLNVAQALAALKSLGYKVWDASEHDTPLQLIGAIYGVPSRVLYEMITGNGWDD